MGLPEDSSLPVRLNMDIPESLPVLMDMSGALMVEGIENWIQGLLQIEELDVNGQGAFLRVVDSKTKAEFLIKRTK